MRKSFLLLTLLCQLSVSGQQRTGNLVYYLDEAIRNSPLLNDYRNQANAARADSILARASRKPYIEARSQLQYFPLYGNFGYDEVITNGGNYTAVMGISQNILNSKSVNNRYRSIDLQKQSIRISAELSSIDLRRIITDQYITAYTVFRDLEFNRSFLVLSNEESELVKGFVRRGISRQTDYMALQIETQSQEILVKQLEGAYRKELNTLNRLSGISDTSFVRLNEPMLEIKQVPDISRSPVMMQYDVDSIRIENDRAAVDLRYTPKVSWYADAGFLSHSPWNFYNHFGYSAGLSLSIPVYDGRQRNTEKQKLSLSENSRRAYEENYKKQYSQKLAQLNNDLKTLTETYAQLEDQLALSDQLVKALKKQLEAGMVLMTDYINAIRNYRSINRNLLVVNLQKLQVINEMNYITVQ
jgi:outer membrane protein TolC